MASLDEFCRKVSKGSVCGKMQKVTESLLAHLNFLTSVWHWISFKKELGLTKDHLLTQNKTTLKISPNPENHELN